MTALKAALFGSIAALTLASTANAELLLKYSTNGGVTFTTITNQGAGDTSASTKTVRADLAVGSVDITVTGNDGGHLYPYEIHANVIGTAGATGSLIFYVTSTDYDTPPWGTATIKSTLGISENPGTVTWASYIDLDNTAFGTGTLLATSTTSEEGASAGDTEIDGISFTDDTFSLTQYFAINWNGRNGMNLVGTATFVPEPAALALLGAGLLGLGLARRRKTV